MTSRANRGAVVRSDGDPLSVPGGRSVVDGGSVEDEVYKQVKMRILAVYKCSWDTMTVAKSLLDPCCIST